MERIKLSKDFYLDEYVPMEVYKANIHRPHVLMRMVREKLVEADQKLRDKFGPVTINNWYHGGDRQWSGVRLPGSEWYNELSGHSYGCASDKVFRDVDAEEVREYIRNHWKWLGITEIENEVLWVHSSVNLTGERDLIQYVP